MNRMALKYLGFDRRYKILNLQGEHELKQEKRDKN